MFDPLNLPKATLRLKRKENALFVWDIFRKKEILLTPEEWVRQHFFHFLITHKAVPLGLLTSEYSIKVNDLARRCDGVIFDNNKKPLAIIECKAADVKLSENTLHQIAQYNFTLQVQWLILTNGLQTIVCFVDFNERKLSYLEEVPVYEKMISLVEKRKGTL